jgi:hypothetical protein
MWTKIKRYRASNTEFHECRVVTEGLLNAHEHIQTLADFAKRG